jgi:hypothetical protein
MGQVIAVVYGVVKFYDNRIGRNYGFISVLNSDYEPTGKEIFFHYGDGRYPENNGQDSVFFGDNTTKIGGQLVPLRTPKAGDMVVFSRTPGKDDRPKASPWTYAADWVHHELQVDQSETDLVEEAAALVGVRTLVVGDFGRLHPALEDHGMYVFHEGSLN